MVVFIHTYPLFERKRSIFWSKQNFRIFRMYKGMKIKKRVKKSHSISARLKLREEKYVVIYHRNKLWRTGIVVNSPDEFNLRDGVLKANYRGTENYEVLNVRLKEQLGLINKLINDAVKQGLDTLKYIDVHHRDEEAKLKKLHVAKNTPLVVAFAEYLKIKKEKVKKIQKDSSFDRYKSELSRLQDYNKGRNINVRDLLDIDWFYDFAEYLSTPKMREYEIYDSRREMTYKCTKEIKQTNSTIARFLQDLITFLKDVELNSNMKFPIQGIADYMNSLSVPTDDTDNVIAMTKAQWLAFKKYTPNPKFEADCRAYDLFRFSVNTGLRYSDVIKLHNGYVRDESISMLATKTRHKFQVSMNEDAIRIFNKYDRDFRGKFASNQQLNSKLTEVLSRIEEFQHEEMVREYVLDEIKEYTVPAYMLFSFHSSRRSFVSFLIQAGATPDIIMRATGWKSLKSLNHYMKIFGDKDNSDLKYLTF